MKYKCKLNVRVIISGSKSFDDYDLLKEKCMEILRPHMSNPISIISGADGTCKLGEQLARDYRLHCVRMPADWDRYGERAGFLRNLEVVDYANQDGSIAILIAFWDGKSEGTKHMIDIARERKMPVYVINYH